MQPLSIKFRDWVCKKPPLEEHFFELHDIYLSRDIKPFSELYGQRLYKVRW
jgi:hypothetical protein